MAPVTGLLSRPDTASQKQDFQSEEMEDIAQHSRKYWYEGRRQMQAYLSTQTFLPFNQPLHMKFSHQTTVSAL